MLSACNQPVSESTPENEPEQAGQSAVQDNESKETLFKQQSPKQTIEGKLKATTCLFLQIQVIL